MPAPTPEYNFKQLPFVRGLDPFWIEKREGNKEMTAAEPVGDIHMPNPSFSPICHFFRIVYSGIWCDVYAGRKR